VPQDERGEPELSFIPCSEGWCAPQALEAACWSALLQAPRAVMAGDHLQLPPTILSEAAERQVCMVPGAAAGSLLQT
jgi:superfamily I DNA and/or RNA helicase